MTTTVSTIQSHYWEKCYNVGWPRRTIHYHFTLMEMELRNRSNGSRNVSGSRNLQSKFIEGISIKSGALATSGYIPSLTAGLHGLSWPMSCCWHCECCAHAPTTNHVGKSAMWSRPVTRRMASRSRTVASSSSCRMTVMVMFPLSPLSCTGLVVVSLWFYTLLYPLPLVVSLSL